MDAVKSCQNCPSFLTDTQAGTFFNKGIGAPVCARFGKPIGNRNSTDEQRRIIGESFAENCAGYGMPKPNAVDWGETDFRVSLPDPDVLAAPNKDQNLVSSCRSCEWFVREDNVLSDLGWAAGLCSAKGKLLFTNRLVFEARDCEDRSFGTPRTDTNGLHFLPAYQPNFRGIRDPARHFNQERNKLEIEPSEYPTDAPVSSDDEKDGIRAWREIKSPYPNGESVYLPIFNKESFDSEERLLIPKTGDEQHPEDHLDHGQNIYRAAVVWMILDETPAFWGSSGTGKTEFFRHMAWLMQLPFHRFAIKRSTNLDELEGTKEYDPDVGTYFRPGRFVKAWGRPGVGDVDEANTGKPEVWHFLRPIMDASKMLVVDSDDTGKPYMKHEYFLVGIAMNPAWDDKNIGAEEISDADARRLHHFKMELPPADIEKKIIRKRIERDGYQIDDDKLDFLMKVAEDVRGAVDDGNLPVTWGIGNQLKVARALKYFPVEECYRMAIGDFLEPVYFTEFMRYVNNHIE